MEFASPELCVEIFELTDWGHNFKKDPTGDIWAIDKEGNSLGLCSKGGWALLDMDKLVPAYSLNYLLEKARTTTDNLVLRWNGDWWICAIEYSKTAPKARGDIAADAAARLCIKLSKEGFFK